MQCEMLLCLLLDLRSALLVIVDLCTVLPALLRPGEVSDGNEEEGVAAIGDTSEGVVPSNFVSCADEMLNIG